MPDAHLETAARAAPRERLGVFRAAALGLSLLALTACGGKGGDEAAAEASGRADNVMGDPNAPVTVIEYASVTCPHCKTFHDQIWPEFKTRFIDTGEVKFVFRELPTPPASLAMAGFLLARCAPQDKYFDVLDLLFDKQEPLIRAYQAGGGAARDELVKIAAALDISETRFDACIRDEDEIERISRIDDEATQQYGVSGTPTFIIDGESYPAMTVDDFAEIIDPLLPSEGGT